MISFRGKLVTDERTDERTAANLKDQPPKGRWVQKICCLEKFLGVGNCCDVIWSESIDCMFIPGAVLSLFPKCPPGPLEALRQPNSPWSGVQGGLTFECKQV